jgi:hypothetical protein
MSSTLYVATLDTRYSFMTAGETREDAVKAMRLAWSRHRRQTGATWAWADMVDDVQVVELHPGTALRDGSPF